MMKECVLLLLEESGYNPMIETMFMDFTQLPSYHVIIEKNIQGKLMHKLLSSKFQELTHGCFNRFFLSKSQLELFLEDNYQKYDKFYLIYLNSSFIFSKPPYRTLMSLKSKYKKLKFILFYIDIIKSPQSRHANYLRQKGLFDIVYTIDKDDALETGLPLWNTPYSKIPNADTVVGQQSDVYFCGGRKNRAPLISEFYKKGNKYGLEVNMDVIYNVDDFNYYEDIQNSLKLHKEGNYISYEEVLENTLNTHCILDIVQAGQKALTLRPYEAVVYNKKLLTNNPSILDFKYYDHRYMKYFKTIEDIDWEWLKEEVSVDYQYSNDFSPILLLEKIRNS